MKVRYPAPHHYYPVNPGEPVNSPEQERFPMLSPNGKYLFFTRQVAPGNEDVIWGSTKVIEKLKEEKL